MIIETALLYEYNAKNCNDPINKLFLYYLAGKKRVHHVLLEMIANSSDNKKILFHKFSSEIPVYPICDELISNSTTEKILLFAQKKAEKDYNLFKGLATLEEDLITKKLLTTLSELSSDFKKDIVKGYLKFIRSESMAMTV
jgi:hypothetical protein